MTAGPVSSCLRIACAAPTSGKRGSRARARGAFAVLAAITVGTVPARLEARPLTADEAQVLRAEIARLRSRVDELERRLEGALPEGPQVPEVPAAAGVPVPVASAAQPAFPATAAGTATAPSPSLPPAPDHRIEWAGAPRTETADRAFKVRGRIQADANHVSTPKGLADQGLGFSSELRRVRIGAEGQLGSGFGYRMEVDVADNDARLFDAVISYRNGGLMLLVGNHNPVQALDELTGGNHGSFMERAAFTDAFNFERRLGFSAHYRTGALLVQGGMFTDDVASLADQNDGPAGGDENNSFSIDGRVVYAPRLGNAGTLLHFGTSAHWRDLGRVAAAPTRYRQRPFVHSSNSRLISTAPLAVDREFSHGVELATVAGRLHAVVEGHWLHARLRNGSSPVLRGGYAEIGYFLTDDSRGYDNGAFTPTRPRAPLGKGGFGALQANLRYDHLDLDSGSIRGGRQNAYLASLIWSPVQFLRFNLNYGYLDYSGAVALPDGSTSYGVHVVGSRVELEF